MRDAKLQDAKLQDAVEILTDISERADAAGRYIVGYPVPEVREVLAGLRRMQMARVTTPSGEMDGGER